MQKKNREGFTLIELLAVIVILAIIALIAVPVIMNVITKARVSAFEDSAYGIVKAGELYYSNQLLEPEGMTGDKEFIISNGAFVGDVLDVSGSLPSSGKVTVTSEGKVALAISNGEYCIQKSTSESKVKAVKQANCTDYKKTANPIFTTSDANASIPVCIIDNTECDAGTPVAVKVNNTDEPLDFYVMSEDTDNGTITLIMNKNLGETVAWLSEDDYLKAGGTEWCDEWGFCGDHSKGPLTALNYLENQTSNWTNIPLEPYELIDDDMVTNKKYEPMTRTARARLITKSETLGCATSGDCPTWLYGNLSSSEAPYAYWTSSGYYSDAYTAWSVRGTGCDLDDNIDYGNGIGIRPVITISKTIL